MTVRVTRQSLFTAVLIVVTMAWIIFLFTFGILSTQSKHVVSLQLQQNATTLRSIQRTIENLSRFIHKAKIHVRGTKTSDYLRKALNELDYLMDAFDIDKDATYKRHVPTSRNVCPEIYKGSRYGSPMFYTGFEETNCRYGKPMRELVTVIVLNNDTDMMLSTHSKIKRLVESILNVYDHIRINVNSRFTKKCAEIFKDTPSVRCIIKYPGTDGAALNRLIARAFNPYVLIARDTDFFTGDSRLSRLVREIDNLGVAVAGGAWRDSDGHWTHGCFQTVFRNSTFKFVHGYDESLHECLFCDHLTGPFIARTDIFRKYYFQDFNISEGLFEEWFYRLRFTGYEVISCPDSMFHVRKPEIQNNYDKFIDDLNILKLVDQHGRTLHGKCKESRSFYKKRALSPCKLNTNSQMVKFIMSVCNSSGVVCETQDGTTLGALKFGKVLPWERDGDIGFLTENFTAILNTASKFTKEGYKFESIAPELNGNENKQVGGRFYIYSTDWRIELVGQDKLDSNTLQTNGMSPTKALLDGQWVNVPMNPGLVARDRYGREIYKHALHWMDTESRDEWEPYKPTEFPSCGSLILYYRASHECLERYNADGSLQFSYILP